MKKTEDKIRERLITKGMELFRGARRFELFANNPDADALLNDLENTPHAFVIACVMDRQIKFERAFLIPYYLAEKLGTFEFAKLRELELEEIQEIMQSLHRFPNEMSLNLVNALELIDTRYHQRASMIWDNKPSSATVVSRFLEFRGIGLKIATMAANILARRFKVPFSDYYSIDISPDVHVRRVLERLGLIRKKASIEELVYRTRALHPQFPGILDYPVWQIGRQWCKSQRPICSKCYMNDVCPSTGTFHAKPE